jgi:TetR/AcrR family transcriptional regulator, transcriptional repressor for nem operon
VKTPATSKGQRSKSLITETAARLMHEKGIDATSIDDVLAASRTGKSQAYHYFSGKEDLVAAVLEFQFSRVMAAQPVLHDETCTDLRRWRQEVLAANESGGFAGCPLGAFAGQLDGSTSLEALYADLFARWQAALAALVDRARSAGQLPPSTSPHDTALVLLGALEGGSMLSHVRHRQDDLERMLDAALASVGVPQL